MRICCLCNYICKRLDIQVFSNKDYKPQVPPPASSVLHGQQGKLHNPHTRRKEQCTQFPVLCCGLVSRVIASRRINLIALLPFVQYCPRKITVTLTLTDYNYDYDSRIVVPAFDLNSSLFHDWILFNTLCGCRCSSRTVCALNTPRLHGTTIAYSRLEHSPGILQNICALSRSQIFTFAGILSIIFQLAKSIVNEVTLFQCAL